MEKCYACIVADEAAKKLARKGRIVTRAEILRTVGVDCNCSTLNVLQLQQEVIDAALAALRR